MFIRKFVHVLMAGTALVASLQAPLVAACDKTVNFPVNEPGQTCDDKGDKFVARIRGRETNYLFTARLTGGVIAARIEIRDANNVKIPGCAVSDKVKDSLSAGGECTAAFVGQARKVFIAAL